MLFGCFCLLAADCCDVGVVGVVVDAGVVGIDVGDDAADIDFCGVC